MELLPARPQNPSPTTQRRFVATFVPTVICRRRISVLLLTLGLACGVRLQAQTPTVSPLAPVVTRVEPPNWWVGITPELQLLVYGRRLQATHVACNVPALHVSRTQATAGGDYLFVWLKVTPDARSGTAVCRVTTAEGETSFELPLAARATTLGKFQGLAPQDAIYLIMPDRFADGDPTNDEPKPQATGVASPSGSSGNRASHTTPTFDRSKPRAYHGGDLRGIREHLPYLQELGVTTLWLTPIVKNGAAQDYHGYGAVDLYAVDGHLGTLDDYRELVAAAHKLKMKVFFDIVPNHVGPLHPWLKNPPLPDWFHGTAEHHLNTAASIDPSFYGQPGKAQGSNDPFEALIDPHAPPALSRSLTEGWFFGVLPDMNTENPMVAQYLLQNAIWWTESSGLDGLRVDTFPYVSRTFWSGWNAGLHSIYPYLTTIGEVYHPDPEVTSFFVGGQRRWDGVDSGLNAVFDFPLCFALRDIVSGDAPVGRIANILRQDGLYPHADNLVTFFTNHDMARLTADGDTSLTKLKLAYGLVLTLRGIPEIYYGDEIALPGGGDPDNRRDFPGGWIGDTQDAFVASGRTAIQQEIFSYTQSLLHLRREHVALQIGHLWHLFSDDSAYVFLRDVEEEHLLVAFNRANAPGILRIPRADTPLAQFPAATPLFGEGAARVTNDELQLTLPPQSITIFNMF
jgi:neopullulanase